ncbi:sce7726 family protein [Pseudomonas sp. FP1740]|uniref:sce7726 family protein n=1 Tax=Pseudomonas sp. FP1740 TaxID=2954078 RepID=UPI0027336B13|nr:sce7726 family protein [Pseudomonas sp. FP1740]WLG45222.1 sce7726 family protein [Pseudomonas sp. FP1740]
MTLLTKILDGNQQSALAKLFSAAVVRELAQKGRSPLFARLINEHLVVKTSSLTEPISAIFESAFTLLTKKDYRHEYAYKSAITRKLLLGRHSLKTASMVTEFRVGSSKADAAIFNGTSTAYEIKSERDNLGRLNTQLDSYKKFFSKVYVITGENHLSEVIDTTPQDIGVLVLNKRFGITTIREVSDSPSRVSTEAIFDSIQLQESLDILKHFDITPPKLPNTEIRSAIREIFKTLDPAATHHYMVQTLRRTRSSLHLTNLLSSTPKSLQAAILSTPLKTKEQKVLLEAINTKTKEALNWAK